MVSQLSLDVSSEQELDIVSQEKLKKKRKKITKYILTCLNEVITFVIWTQVILHINDIYGKEIGRFI